MSAGQCSFSIDAQTNGSEIIEMGGFAGYDHVMIDWEYGLFGADSVVSMIRAA